MNFQAHHYGGTFVLLGRRVCFQVVGRLLELSDSPHGGLKETERILQVLGEATEDLQTSPLLRIHEAWQVKQMGGNKQEYTQRSSDT